jgi:hypothetical protein
MDANLPATGTAEYLRLLSPYVPDSFINNLLPHRRARGRRPQLSPAQLYRIHLLSVLTPVHAFNHLVRLLPEQGAWRRFAHLPNCREVPDVWGLNQFREQCGVSALRRINDQLLAPLLPPPTGEHLSVALIDATDLEAACSGHKKRPQASIRHSALRWAGAPSSAAKAVSSSATRSTPCAFGCETIGAGSCWCPWSVG